jgi:hypothetical protein
MKDILKSAVTLLTILLVGGLSGIMLDRKVLRPSSVRTEIKTVYEPVVKYVKVVSKDDTSELWKAYNSSIKMTFTPGQVKDGVMPFNVFATDDYKSTSQSVDITVGSTEGWKMKIAACGLAAIAGGYLVYKIK